ncbi:MAG: head maturation protease, ClpP-related [Velocimicrobium sp.]
MAKNITVKGVIVPNEDKWIYEWFGMDATCPQDVQDAIAEANGEDLVIEISSGGGDVFCGDEIYSAIINYDGNVMIQCIYAGSAASVILCAAKSEITAPGMVMIHNASTGASGDYNVMDKTSEFLKKVNEAISAAYMEKTGLSKEELLDLMNKATWMTAEEAVEYGFCDAIMKSKNKNSPKSSQLNNEKMVAVNADHVLDREVIEKIRSTIQNSNVKNNAPFNSILDGTGKEHFFNNKSNQKNKKKEGIKMEITNVEQLKAEYPALVQEVENDAAENAVNEERVRMQEIDSIAGSLTSDIVNDAKYKNPVNAEKLAFQAMQTNATLGASLLNQMVKDIEDSNANEVTTNSANSGNNDGKDDAKAESQKKASGFAAALSKAKGKQ